MSNAKNKDTYQEDVLQVRNEVFESIRNSYEDIITNIARDFDALCDEIQMKMETVSGFKMKKNQMRLFDKVPEEQVADDEFVGAIADAMDTIVTQATGGSFEEVSTEVEKKPGKSEDIQIIGG